MALPPRLSPGLAQELGYYVYALRDRRSGRIFYVGRGQNDRVLQHEWEAGTTTASTPKLDHIRALWNAGSEVEQLIIRRQLSETSAREVEAALIDALPLHGPALLNEVRGDHVERGMRHLTALRAEFAAVPLETLARPEAIVVGINNTWFEGISPTELWEMSRSWWKCRPDKRPLQARLLLAVAQQVVRGAWALDPGALGRQDRPDWQALGPTKQRVFFKDDRTLFEANRFEGWRFDGVPAPDAARYLGATFGFVPRSAFQYLDPMLQAVA